MHKLENIKKLSAHKGKVWSASWHPSGNIISSCGEDKTIRIWSRDKDKDEWIMQTVLSDGHTRTIRDVAWSPCGQYLASASFDATIAIWDKKSGEFECNSTLEGHENEVKSVAWSTSGQFLATCSRDKSVWIWEMSADEFDCSAVLNSHTQDVKKVTWHPNADVLASASYDNLIKLYKEDPSDFDWNSYATLQSHSSTVWSIAFDKNGDRLISCSDDNTLKVWQEYKVNNEEGIPTPENEPVWKCVCTLSGYHERSIYDVAWCKLTGLIATACGDDMIRIFKECETSTKNEPTFELVTKLHAHKQDVNSVRWNPVERGLLMSTSDDGDIKLWKFDE